MAWRAASWATCWAAKAVLLREPLNPTRPALDQPRMLPCMSVMATMVLLKVARMFATPELMFFAPLALMIFFVAASSASNSAAVGAATAGAPPAGGAAAAAASAPLAGSPPSPAAFFGALGGLPSAEPLAAAGWGGESGFPSGLEAGFLDWVSSAIKKKAAQWISGCRFWRSDCAGRRR